MNRDWEIINWWPDDRERPLLREVRRWIPEPLAKIGYDPNDPTTDAEITFVTVWMPVGVIDVMPTLPEKSDTS